MRVTPGTFSYLPDLTDEEITAQVQYVLDQGWPCAVEYTDDPHPRNSLWEMWRQPRFDLAPDEADIALEDVQACRATYPNHYIKVVCYDPSLGAQTSRLSFIVNRPAEEPGFRLERQETRDRQIHYTLHPYAANDPIGRRYGNDGSLATERDPGGTQEATPGLDAPAHARRDGASPGGDAAAASDEGIGES